MMDSNGYLRGSRIDFRPSDLMVIKPAAPLIEIQPGDWVLAFYQPYGPYFNAMPQHLEKFAKLGGGWDCAAEEIFLVHQVSRVMPNTYLADGESRQKRSNERMARSHVISAHASEWDATEQMHKLYMIGASASVRIELEAERRIEKFAARERAKAVAKIHKLLPHFFEKGKA